MFFLTVWLRFINQICRAGTCSIHIIEKIASPRMGQAMTGILTLSLKAKKYKEIYSVSTIKILSLYEFLA